MSNTSYGENAKERFRRIVVRLHESGTYPSERAITKALAEDTIGDSRSRGEHRKDLNGRECRWRREVFAELGIELRGWNGFQGAQPAPDFSAVNDQTEVR